MTDKDTSVYFLTARKARELASARSSSSVTPSQALALLDYPDDGVRSAAIDRVRQQPTLQQDADVVRVFLAQANQFDDVLAALALIERFDQPTRDSFAEAIVDLIPFAGTLEAFRDLLSQEARDGQADRLIARVADPAGRTLTPRGGHSAFEFLGGDKGDVALRLVKLMANESSIVRNNAEDGFKSLGGNCVTNSVLDCMERLSRQGELERKAVVAAFRHLSPFTKVAEIELLAEQLDWPGEVGKSALRLFTETELPQKIRDSFAPVIAKSFESVGTRESDRYWDRSVDDTGGLVEALAAYESLSEEAQATIRGKANVAYLRLGHSMRAEGFGTIPFWDERIAAVIDNLSESREEFEQTFPVGKRDFRATEALGRLLGAFDGETGEKVEQLFVKLAPEQRSEASREMFAEVFKPSSDQRNKALINACARVIPLAVDPDQFRQLMDSTDPALDAPRMAGLKVLQQMFAPTPDKSPGRDIGGL